MINAYLYRSCSSCRKAEALLDEEGAQYETREYFKQKVTRAELDKIIKQTRLAVNDILST